MQVQWLNFMLMCWLFEYTRYLAGNDIDRYRVADWLASKTKLKITHEKTKYKSALFMATDLLKVFKVSLKS